MTTISRRWLPVKVWVDSHNRNGLQERVAIAVAESSWIAAAEGIAMRGIGHTIAANRHEALAQMGADWGHAEDWE